MPWKTWTALEIETARRWAADGRNAVEIAAGLDGRTAPAVRNIMKRLEIESLVPPHRPAKEPEQVAEEEDDRTDDSWVVRCAVYEAAIGKTRGETVAVLAGVYGAKIVDQTLAELTSSWRTDGGGPYKAVLAKPSPRGRYVRVEDKDMIHDKEPRTPGIRRHGRAA